MSKATALLSKVNVILTKFQATDRAVYKRIITRAGGDLLIGKPATVTNVDTLFSPQPAVFRPHPNDPLVLASTSSVLATDYKLIVSGSMVTRAELANPDLVIVFKDGSAEEVLHIVGWKPQALNGIDVAFSILAGSRKR